MPYKNLDATSQQRVSPSSDEGKIGEESTFQVNFVRYFELTFGRTNYLRQGGNVFPAFVCLSVRLAVHVKTGDRIFMKLLPEIYLHVDNEDVGSGSRIFFLKDSSTLRYMGHFP